MNSNKLEAMGLVNHFSARPLDFRSGTRGPGVKEDLQALLGQDAPNLKAVYTGRQDHTANVVLVDEKTQGEDFFYGEIFDKTDGLVTSLRNTGLVIKVADCSPILLFDPVNHAFANLHSGWRGTLARISQEAIDLMVQAYGTQPQDLHAFIGPSIGYDDFEIMEDVKALWEEEFDFAQEVMKRKDQDHFLLDLKETNRRSLVEAGLRGENIEVSPLSTYSDPRVHSYRRDAPSYGLNAMLAYLI